MEYIPWSLKRCKTKLKYIVLILSYELYGNNIFVHKINLRVMGSVKLVSFTMSVLSMLKYLYIIQLDNKLMEVHMFIEMCIFLCSTCA